MQAIAHPGWPQARMTVETLPEDPDLQVSAVVARMREYAIADASHPNVTAAVSRAAAEYPSEDIADSIFNWVKSAVSFRHDETRSAEFGGLGGDSLVEVLTRPADLLSMSGERIGDCDDYAMLTASMLLAAGRPAFFCTVATDKSAPGRWSHVYVETIGRDGRRLPLDTSHGPYPGWSARDAMTVYKEQRWPVRAETGLLLLLAVAVLAARYFKLWS